MPVDCFKITDLETGAVTVYGDRSFCPALKISERNFRNRWRSRTTAGIVFFNRYYVTKIEIKVNVC